MAQYDLEMRYYDEQMYYMQSALSRLVLGFEMNIQPPSALSISHIPLPPISYIASEVPTSRSSSDFSA
ncbi:hypothetical protein PanWU01x14_285060 [Parasponia andersonii]|uniref:Uncharacterized protein n=1 Tax=Parasponia andersonii TaxID=3476 RepID=A0A2P5AZP4_PARAD|nr:hypothetical protein PanWU01x14_285060 [Parasponia andersonii]